MTTCGAVLGFETAHGMSYAPTMSAMRQWGSTPRPLDDRELEIRRYDTEVCRWGIGNLLSIAAKWPMGDFMLGEMVTLNEVIRLLHPTAIEYASIGPEHLVDLEFILTRVQRARLGASADAVWAPEYVYPECTLPVGHDGQHVHVTDDLDA